MVGGEETSDSPAARAALRQRFEQIEEQPVLETEAAHRVARATAIALHRATPDHKEDWMTRVFARYS